MLRINGNKVQILENVKTKTRQNSMGHKECLTGIVRQVRP